MNANDWKAWGLQVEAPLRLDDVERFDFAESADLVVVGLGGAGVAAALEGVERGLDVLALDRYDGGGSSSANGGVFYAGGGTSIQREAGETDTPEEMYKYLKLEVGDVVSDATLRQFCDESVE
ncbi:MAG: FAD-dependent oxidoreductase, partial [Pseudomonadota bacterium]|nr:FAD-dependent oxidoreductase [Pseudomonadota bacterium]